MLVFKAVRFRRQEGKLVEILWLQSWQIRQLMSALFLGGAVGGGADPRATFYADSSSP